jgi:hypothetical protein
MYDAIAAGAARVPEDLGAVVHAHVPPESVRRGPVGEDRRREGHVERARSHERRPGERSIPLVQIVDRREDAAIADGAVRIAGGLSECVIGHRDARLDRGCRIPDERAVHSQRLEDVRVQEVGHSLAAQPLDDGGEENVPRVAVAVSGSRWRHER